MRPTMTAPQEVILEWAEVAVQQAVPGLHRVHSDAWLSDISDVLVVSLRGYLLKDQGGEPVTADHTVWRKVRPRWIPAWLWRRVPEERKTITLTTTPEWSYPQATIRVPDLQPAVRFMTNELDPGEWA